MGATDFQTRDFGANAREAFGNAVRDAQHWHGHGGYTGTIAEKGEYIEFDVPDGLTPDQFVDLVQAVTWDYESDDLKRVGGKPSVKLWSFYTENDHKIGKLWDSLDDPARIAVVEAFRNTDDKWGPAGCVCLGHTSACGSPDVKEYAFFGWASE